MIDATIRMPGITLIYNQFSEFTNVIGSYYMGMKQLHDGFTASFIMLPPELRLMLPGSTLNAI